MGQNRLLSTTGGVLLAAGCYAACDHAGSAIPMPVGVVPLSAVELKSAPIRKEWILQGNPATFAREIARSADGSTTVFVWQTSAGRFNWLHESEEIVTILDGEVFVSDASAALERRLGPGDVAFFPQGAATVWRVPDHVRKVATLKRALPGPIAGVVRILQMAKNWLKPTAAFAAD